MVGYKHKKTRGAVKVVASAQAETGSEEASSSAATAAESHAHGSKASMSALLPAPPLSRLYAYVIDWFVGGIVSGLPAVLLYAAVTRRTDMFSSLYVFEALGYPWALGIGAGVMCALAAVFYFVVVPLVIWPGQTLGKRIAHVQVVRMDGSRVTACALVVRQVLVGFLLEGSGFVVARYIREAAVLITRFDVNYYWEIAGMAITLLSGLLALVCPARRALHDYVAGTRVVPAAGHPMYRE